MNREIKLTQRQRETLEYLKKSGEYVSPTEVGRLFGGHSAIGSPICKRLVLLGYVERNEKGYYKIKT